MSSLRARRISRNPFAFPGGNPGFNPAHIAAGSRYSWSAVALGAAMVGVAGGTSGQVGTINSGPLSAGVGVIGPFCGFSTAQSINPPASVQLAAYPTTTMGAIFVFQSGNGALFSNTTGTTVGLALNISTVSVSIILNGGGAYTLGGPTPVANVPYFCGCTVYDNSKAVFVLRRLDSGSATVWTATNSAAAQTTPTGGFRINRTASGSSPASQIAAVMYSNAALDANGLLAWSADPFSFWYPVA